MNRTQVVVRRFEANQMWATLGLIAALSFTGCGSGDPATAKVSGSIKANGKEVSGGTLIVSPIAEGKSHPGKSAEGVVEDDGTFTLTTYKDGDGAVVGKCSVRYVPRAEEPLAPSTAGGHVAARPGPYDGLVAKPNEFEVKAGVDNTLEIELVKPGKQ